MDDELMTCIDPEVILSSHDKRATCSKCRRPETVCWCSFLPNPPLVTKTNVIVLQHPYEDKRCLSTTPMLQHSIDESRCTVLQGPRFKLDSLPQLKEAVLSPNTYLLYPAKDALPLDSLPPQTQNTNLLVLDGTWMQAKGIVGKNSFLHTIKKVKVEKPPLSKYVIRTQPTDECLSTLESVALALEILESRPGLYDMLTRPLTALCDFQLSHGALVHQSKEYLMNNGLHKSQNPTKSTT